MNLRGRVICKYLASYPDKLVKSLEGVRGVEGYKYVTHSNRMDALLIDSYILANRVRIISEAENLYGQLLTPYEVVERLIPSEPDNGFTEVCCLEMGFAMTNEDIDKAGQLDYNLYTVELKEQLLKEVLRVFQRIDSTTLKLAL